jgi:probable phosphoglycerate mutase
VLIASDLVRSAETAAILAAHWGLEPRHDPRLREIDIGAWTGLTREQIALREADQLARFEAEELSARPGGGETRLEIRARARRAAAELVAAHRGRRLALVTHLGVIRALVPGAEPANAAWLRVALRDLRPAHGDEDAA